MEAARRETRILTARVQSGRPKRDGADPAYAKGAVSRPAHTSSASTSSAPKLGAVVAPALLASLTAVAAGCTGFVSGADGPMDAPDRVVTGIAVGEGFVKRLTRAQYDHVVSDLFGRDIAVSAAFPGDDNSMGYTVGRTLSGAHVEAYFTGAEQIAATVTEDLSALLPCDAAAVDEACVGSFVDDFVVRAYRRPITDEERADLIAAFAAGKEAFGTREGIEILVARVLSSPHFLYLVEENPSGAKPGDIVRLRAHEIATRLAFLLWDSGPDRELIDAASDGALDTEEGIRAQALRLLADARSRRGFRDFSAQWLLTNKLAGLEKSGAAEWNDALAADMTASVDAFVDEVVWEQSGGLKELLTADFAYVPASMAGIFGVDAPGGGAMSRMETLPKHAGLLNQPGLLAATTHDGDSDAILRGKFVRERLLCDTLGDPPPGIPDLGEKQPGETNRERFARHTSDEACSGCHRLMDPIGFGFENFDGLGRFRETDNGEPIDANGEILDGADASGTFTGTAELAAKLAASEKSATCVAKQLFRYSMGRAETNDEHVSVEQIRAAADPEDGAIRAMLEGVVTSDSFLHRVIPKETQP
jgi:hypothetical protein